jgi:hypothetical protein
LPLELVPQGSQTQDEPTFHAAFGLIAFLVGCQYWYQDLRLLGVFWVVMLGRGVQV